MATGVQDAQSVKATVLRLLRAIRERGASYSFRLVQAQLRANDMPSSVGWQPLIDRYEEVNYPAISHLWTTYIETLQKILDYSYFCGKSAVWFINGEENDLTTLAGYLPNLVDTESDFHTSFPFPLSGEDLLRQSMTPVPTSFLARGEDEKVLVMCSKRAFRERVNLVVGELSEEARTALHQYEELIGVRSGFNQAFDRFVVRPSDGLFEVHVDLCCPMNAEELNQYYQTYINRLKEKILATHRDPLRWLGNPVNLFPKITALYNSPDGRILNLGHATGTQSIKEERMRNRQLDLREELFHKHGIRAIQDTDAYSIKKGWSSEETESTPCVSVNGHFSRAGSPHAAVRYAIIEGCASPADVSLIRDKLFS